MEIKARLTRRDSDIKAGLSRLTYREGELVSDIVREGVRMILRKRGAIDDSSKAGHYRGNRFPYHLGNKAGQG